ncbi:MAG: Sir2 family NAD-dependent protein deacetylase, partial [Verrucomicrobiota bacterium]
EMANPAAFTTDPEFAWGFYGHRLNLYRNTEPHEGFQILQRWAKDKPGGAFVMTSNVDGHFQKAGFSEEAIYEVHGSIHYLQSSDPSAGSGIWSADGLEIEVEEATMRAVSSLPMCAASGAVARPNILMFDDWSYDGTRNDEQLRRLEIWLAEQEDSSIAIVEMGAGSAVPTVRHFSEDVVRRNRKAILLRINPREPEIPFSAPHLSIRMGAREALERIDDVL